MDNARLDSLGFTPFAKISDQGMSVPISFCNEYGEKPDQAQIHSQGNAYIRANFPHLDRI